MGKLLTKGGKVFIKDGKVMFGDECCCEEKEVEYIDTCCATCSGVMPKKLRFIETYSRYRLCPCCTYEYDDEGWRECKSVAGWMFDIRIVNEPLTFVLEHRNWWEMTVEEKAKFFPTLEGPPGPNTDYCGDVWIWEGTFDPIKVYHSHWSPMYGMNELSTRSGVFRNDLAEAEFITISLHCTRFNYLREHIKLWKKNYLGIPHVYGSFNHHFTVNSCKPFVTYKEEGVRELVDPNHYLPYDLSCLYFSEIYPYGQVTNVCPKNSCTEPTESCFWCGGYDFFTSLIWYRGYIGEP